jgi:hypothetical protein
MTNGNFVRAARRGNVLALRAEPPPERGRVDVVRERLLAVDRHDGDALAVAALELGVAADVDLVELEREVAPDVLEDAPRGGAKVAALGREERDAVSGRYGYSPRVVVASATRPTPSA